MSTTPPVGYVRFTENRTTVEAIPQHFAAGRVYALAPESCARWVRRRAAEYATRDDFARQFEADGLTADQAEQSARRQPTITLGANRPVPAPPPVPPKAPGRAKPKG